MCRICGGKKTVHGLGYMPTDCVCVTNTIQHVVKAELAEIVDKPQKVRNKRANDEHRSGDING